MTAHGTLPVVPTGPVMSDWDWRYAAAGSVAVLGMTYFLLRRRPPYGAKDDEPGEEGIVVPYLIPQNRVESMGVLS